MEHESCLICDPKVMPEAVPVLPVRNLSEGIQFYLKLGFTLDEENADRALLSRGTSSLKLQAGSSEDGEKIVGVCFFVDCATAFQQELLALQIAVNTQGESRPWRMREIAFTDPDGNQLRFAEKFLDGVYS